jgi:chromosomal replication initiation ATPase DnaA
MQEEPQNLEHQKIWKQVCDMLRESLSEDIFDRWIAVIQPGHRVDDHRMELRVASNFYSTWLEENYVPMISDAFAAVTGNQMKFSLVVDPSLRSSPESDEEKNGIRVTPASASVPPPLRHPAAPPVRVTGPP